jgi:thymidylate synthase ThyX
VILPGSTPPELSERIAASIYQAGHHTTWQHGQLHFSLEGVSRHFLWSFLHAHPFYNSEQVSQRYTRVRRGSFVVPVFSSPRSQALYEDQLERSMEQYRELTRLLFEPCQREFFARFRGREHQPQRWKKDIQKRAQEIARYLLPVATTAHLVHTVSVLTLLRYYRLCQIHDTPSEQRLVVEEMVSQLRTLDPEMEKILEAPLELEDSLEEQFLASRPRLASAAFRNEFDRKLGSWTSLLVSRKTENVRLVADAVREVLGLARGELEDAQAVAMALDPAKNPLLGETLNLTTQSKLTRALHHACYSFRRRLSLSADSQDQRHRMTPASRPILACQVDGEPDYVTPLLLRQDGHREAARLYTTSLEQVWETMGALRQLGEFEEAILYLLPNATPVRYTESTDLLNLRHKHLMRLCYNAQEEIWSASVEEAQQIREVEPEIGSLLLPPCTARARAGVKPFCPEGERYCGVRVWRLDLDEYERRI